VTVEVPKSTWEADIKGSVSGIGYSSVHRVLSNNHPSYSITNLVTLSYESIKKTLSITTTIEPVDGATIEMYNSSSRHPINGWLEGCNDDPNNQIVNENDTQTKTGDETVQEDGPNNEILDSEETY
jgi:hypothetical protein